MSLKITPILILLACLNITLANRNCKVKLYTEEDFGGNHVREIYDFKMIRGEVVKSLMITGDCTWDMYR